MWGCMVGVHLGFLSTKRLLYFKSTLFYVQCLRPPVYGEAFAHFQLLSVLFHQPDNNAGALIQECVSYFAFFFFSLYKTTILPSQKKTKTKQNKTKQEQKKAKKKKNPS